GFDLIGEQARLHLNHLARVFGRKLAQLFQGGEAGLLGFFHTRAGRQRRARRRDVRRNRGMTPGNAPTLPKRVVPTRQNDDQYEDDPGPGAAAAASLTLCLASCHVLPPRASRSTAPSPPPSRSSPSPPR